MNSQLLPFSEAEAVLAPFFDPEIASQIPYRFTPITAWGCQRQGHWCWTILRWDACDGGLVAARLELDCVVPAGHWDRVVVCASIPSEVAWRLRLKVDVGWHDVASGSGEGKRGEIEVALPRGQLEGVELAFTALASGPQRIALSWIGLADGQLRAAKRAARPVWGPEWQGLMESHPGVLRFARGLVFDAADLPRLRARAEKPGWAEYAQRIIASGRRHLARIPEDDIGKHVPWSDERYTRASERGCEPLTQQALELGLAGLLTGEADLQRHAVRYLLSIVRLPQLGGVGGDPSQRIDMGSTLLHP